jgi:hypothetical protein
MSGESHEWNVILVEKIGKIKPGQKELQVFSPTLYGAAMKANKIIKKEHPGLKIRNIWWLDPDRPK